MDSRLVPTKPKGPPKGSWEPDDHGAEGGTARGPGRPTSRSKAEDKGSDRLQRACWIPGSLNGEGAVESRAGLWGAPCGCDLGRTRQEPTDRLCANTQTLSSHHPRPSFSACGPRAHLQVEGAEAV